MRLKKDGTDYGLRFMAEVLKAEHLHWGYFPHKKFSSEKMTLAELKEAQLAYTNHLFSFIPAEVKTILDVGSGLGKTASLLTEKGYQVHCLSDDKYQQTVINSRYPHIPFTKNKFECCTLDEKFDLVLMSESVQYLNWDQALHKLEELLKPKGYLLLSDYFRKTDVPYYKACKILEPFMSATEKNFTLLKEDDITEHVLPTLDFSSYCYDEYILPAANIFADMVQNKVPVFIQNAIKLFFGKQIKKVHHYIWERMPDKFNRHKFKKEMVYIIQLWQKKS